MAELFTQLKYRRKLDSGIVLEILPGDESSKSSLQADCDTCHMRGETTAGAKYCEDCRKVMCERHVKVSSLYHLTGSLACLSVMEHFINN